MGKIYSYEFKFDHKHPDKIIVKNEIEKITQLNLILVKDGRVGERLPAYLLRSVTTGEEVQMIFYDAPDGLVIYKEGYEPCYLFCVTILFCLKYTIDLGGGRLVDSTREIKGDSYSINSETYNFILENVLRYENKAWAYLPYEKAKNMDRFSEWYL